VISSRHPASTKEGRIAIVTNVERGMRWTRRCRARLRALGEAIRERSREACETNGIEAYGEVVWSWHPLLMLSLAEARSAQPVFDAPFNPRGDGGKKELVTGEREGNRSNHCVGNAGCFRCLRCEYWCAYFTTPAHTRLRVHWAPGIPHALFISGRMNSSQSSGSSCRGNDDACLGCLTIETLPFEA
jgi:hypothetical protein